MTKPKTAKENVQQLQKAVRWRIVTRDNSAVLGYAVTRREADHEASKYTGAKVERKPIGSL